METKFLELFLDRDTYLPTPKPCKSGVFENKASTLNWRLGPGDFQNVNQIKPKRHIIFVTVFFTLLVVSVVLSCCSFGSDEKILFYYPHSWDGEEPTENAIRLSHRP